MPFSSLSRQERLIAVHAAYGRAMLGAHALELGLANLLLVHLIVTDATGVERNERLAKIKRQTLGGLIQDFVATYGPSEQLTEELDNMLYFRNELAHRASTLVLAKAHQEDWEARAVEEFDQISSMFTETRALLEPFVAECRARLGVTKETLDELVRRVYPVAADRYLPTRRIRTAPS